VADGPGLFVDGFDEVGHALGLVVVRQREVGEDPVGLAPEPADEGVGQPVPRGRDGEGVEELVVDLGRQLGPVAGAEGGAEAGRHVVAAVDLEDPAVGRCRAVEGDLEADGVALAWRAGATLLNMEMQWWHTNDVRFPANWQRMQVYPNPMLGSWKSARNVNSLFSSMRIRRLDSLSLC